MRKLEYQILNEIREQGGKGSASTIIPEIRKLRWLPLSSGGFYIVVDRLVEHGFVFGHFAKHDEYLEVFVYAITDVGMTALRESEKKRKRLGK